MARAPDIADLEKKLDDGEGDDVLCRRAIEIVERLEYEINLASRGRNARAVKALENERKDFERIIGEIRRRRHDHALDTFVDRVFEMEKKKGRT